jgi:hypothetical protein
MLRCTAPVALAFPNGQQSPLVTSHLSMLWPFVTIGSVPVYGGTLIFRIEIPNIREPNDSVHAVQLALIWLQPRLPAQSQARIRLAA